MSTANANLASSRAAHAAAAAAAAVPAPTSTRGGLHPASKMRLYSHQQSQPRFGARSDARWGQGSGGPSDPRWNPFHPSDPRWNPFDRGGFRDHHSLDPTTYYVLQISLSKIERTPVQATPIGKPWEGQGNMGGETGGLLDNLDCQW
jgi:hypothetical protein